MSESEALSTTRVTSRWRSTLADIGLRTQPAEAHRLRLGVPVVVKVDGSRAILDWDAMVAAWGLQGQFLSQDPMRKPPADGEVVPAVIDPNDSSRANIDWPTHAIERFDTVGFDDDPPAGSIAAQIEEARTTSAGAPTMSTSSQAVIADPTAPVALDGTMQGRVDAFRGGYMKAKDFTRPSMTGSLPACVRRPRPMLLAPQQAWTDRLRRRLGPHPVSRPASPSVMKS